MLYPKIDPKEWSKRYRIPLLEKTCPCCNKDFLADIPVAQEGYRGFETPEHECGEAGVVTILIPVGKREKESWSQIT